MNCPFCFAEYERLVRLGHAETVEWRGVEHAPRLPLSWEESTDADLAELDEEVRRVQVSAPEILIRNPRGRPNSRLAIATLAAIERVNSTAALAARVGLYRALWQEGRDISRPEVIREICEAVGLPGVDAAGEGRRRAKVWTIEWTHGPFDRRIPVLTGETQERLLGLAGPEQLARFLETPFDRLSYQDACREELLHANRKKG